MHQYEFISLWVGVYQQASIPCQYTVYQYIPCRQKQCSMGSYSYQKTVHMLLICILLYLISPFPTLPIKSFTTLLPGWIASYVILEGLTDSHSKAAYINAVFFMTLSLGRVLAIVLAVWVSALIIIGVEPLCCYWCIIH